MTAADQELLDTVFNRSLEVLATADPNELRDAYAVSIDVEDEHGFLPELRLGWNTNARWKACCPKPGQEPKFPIRSILHDHYAGLTCCDSAVQPVSPPVGHASPTRRAYL